MDLYRSSDEYAKKQAKLKQKVASGVCHGYTFKCIGHKNAREPMCIQCSKVLSETPGYPCITCKKEQYKLYLVTTCRDDYELYCTTCKFAQYMECKFIIIYIII